MGCWCKYCDTIVDESEMTIITSFSSNGDVSMRNVWLGCNVCADRRIIKCQDTKRRLRV